MRGFAVRCPLCGAEDNVVVSIGDTSSFSCEACSEGFSADDVRQHIKAWQLVLNWIATAPKREGA